MKKVACLFLFLLALMDLGACSDSDSSMGSDVSDYEDLLSGEDFTLIRSKGKEVTLGTDKSSASIKDRPSMKVAFDYDFFIGNHEVTCAEMGRDCGDSLPVVDITYFDAVLYANKRSIADNLDTFYTYTNAKFDSEGNCVGLDSLEAHYDRDAYRLPTEAEWVYVASLDWNPSKSWHSGNSKYVPHKVCSAYVSAEGICDMAGNVMEWVNDQLVPFSSQPLRNYVGGTSGGLDERVVKGGNFRNDSELMTLYARSDVYTVTSASAAPYVGFRLAFGAIPNPVLLNSSSPAASSNFSVTQGAQVVNVFGGGQAKLAFRNVNSGNLVYVDYTRRKSSVYEIKDSLQVFHPDISPDGRHVAFCTKSEGISGKSEVYVRDLNASGSGLVKLNVESAAIPRWRVLENGDTVIVYVNDAGVNKNEDTFKANSTWQVPFKGGAFGTPKKLFSGAYHGGISKDNKLSVTGARLLRARVGESAKTWYNGEQACNVSLTRNGSKNTLFLDFATATGTSYVGESYSVHERVFFMDSTGKLVRSLKSPKGFTFDHTEWTVGSDSFFVATLTNLDGAHDRVILENAYTGNSVKLIDGGEIWHPALWISPIDSVDPILNVDSAGVYYSDQMMYYGLELRIKMEKFWKERKTATTVVLGSSRAMFGVNDAFVKSEKLVNMAYSSGDIIGMHYLAMHYVLNHAPGLKYLVLEVSPDLLWVAPESSWLPVYRVSPGFQYDENHKFWVDSVPRGIEVLAEEAYKPLSVLTLPYDPDEFLLPTNEWGPAQILHDSTEKTLESPELLNNLNLYGEIVDRATEQGVKVILLVPPQNPEYAKTGSFGIYGLRRSLSVKLLENAKKMNAVLFDENKMGAHDYTADMAYNTDHLSRKGAKQLSGRLDSLLKTLEKR